MSQQRSAYTDRNPNPKLYPLRLQYYYDVHMYFPTNENLDSLMIAKRVPTYLKPRYRLSTLLPEETMHYLVDAELAHEDLDVNHYTLKSRYPTLKSYFILQSIDIPTTFRRAKSLYSPSMLHPQFRLLTMVMRHGLRHRVSKYFSVALSFLANQWSMSNIKQVEIWDWRNLHFLLSNTSIINTKIKSTPRFTYLRSLILDQVISNNRRPVTDSNYIVVPEDWPWDYFLQLLNQYFPLFNFYISKVDKLKRKHSRGKSGKYEISWKYVPPYRRLTSVLRWLARDIRLQKSRTLEKRIFKSLELLFFSPQNHLAHQFRSFVHKYSFQHFKKSLLKTLKTSR